MDGVTLIQVTSTKLSRLQLGRNDRDKLAVDLRKKYDSGKSIRELAASTGRSYGFVHRILSESGTTLRGRGGATRGKAKAKTSV